jgi:periplasmic divalent cation tolerance protein
MSEVLQVVTTTASREEAEQLARELVTRRLAACVQVSGPILSTYRWQGQIETSQEWTCTVKTLLSLYAQVAAAIGELHSYEVPEILALPVSEVSAAYLAWLKAEISPGPS